MNKGDPKAKTKVKNTVVFKKKKKIIIFTLFQNTAKFGVHFKNKYLKTVMCTFT